MTATSSVLGSSTTAGAVRDEYLQLLMTQMKYQDPMDPMNQQDFMQQLTQMSTLEGIENLNARFADLLQLQQLTEGANLVGQTVLYQSADGEVHTGRVDGVYVEDQQLQVVVGGESVSIDQVKGLTASSV
jgi:flagellar basal-body rod modification protein FlgD